VKFFFLAMALGLALVIPAAAQDSTSAPPAATTPPPAATTPPPAAAPAPAHVMVSPWT